MSGMQLSAHDPGMRSSYALFKTVTDKPDGRECGPYRETARGTARAAPGAPHRPGREPHVLDEVERWLERRSWSAAERPLDLLLAAKRALGERGTVSVVLPALDEEATVGA